LLANIYLHYVFDLWVQQWRKTKAKGDVIVVRWAGDFVAGFEHQSDAARFHQELAERFAKFKLKMHPEKTRVIEFGYYAANNRNRTTGCLRTCRRCTSFAFTSLVTGTARSGVAAR